MTLPTPHSEEPEEFQKKQARIVKIEEFNKDFVKAQIEWSRLPWWVQQQEPGTGYDYHYNDWDMEPKEEK